jgi:hypothetical protein
MSTAFDTEVYTERQRLPGVSISLPGLMQHLMWSQGQPASVSLTLEYRSDVDTSQWWTLRWGDQFATGKTLELCLFRAAVLARRDDARAKLYAGIEEAVPSPEAPPTPAPDPPPPARSRDL